MNNRNPWPGLASYNTSYQFCGRSGSSAELLNMIENYEFVTLYGKTGVGKTSLLRAGVFPILEKNGYVPIYVRLGQLTSKVSYTQKLIEDISLKIDCIRYDDEKFDLSSGYDDLDYLWRYFHTRKFSRIDASNNEFSEICPIIILDQFEELFVVNERGARLLLSQINLLLRDTLIVPDEPGYLKKYNCRFVISIREDRLYHLEEAIDKCNLPELRNNRYRLRPLSKSDAKEVVIIPGKKFIEETEAEQITDMIIKHSEEKDGQISSIMLSLICSILYDELEDGQKITLKMVDEQKYNSLRRFYEKTIKEVFPLREQRELFEDLLVDNGHRRLINLKDYKQALQGGEQLYTDDSKKILTKIEVSSYSNDDEHTFVELAHDSLAQVVEQVKRERARINTAPKQNFNYGEGVVELSAIEGRKDVFICYTRDNVEYITRLYEELEKHGIDVWFDRNELHKYVGCEYWERITNGIYNSEFFLLIYTHSLETSDFLLKELQYAVNQNKTILVYPKDFIDIKNSRLREYVKRVQWLDTNAKGVSLNDSHFFITPEKRLDFLSSLVNTKNSNTIYDSQCIYMIRIALQRLLGKVTGLGNYRKLCGTSADEFYNEDNFSLSVVNKAFFIPVPVQYIRKLDELQFFRSNNLRQVETHLEQIRPDRNALFRKLLDFFKEYEGIYTLSVLHDQLATYLTAEKYDSVVLADLKDFTFNKFIDTVAEMTACSIIAELKSRKVIFNCSELGVYSISDSRNINSEKPFVDMKLYYSDYFTFKCMTEMYHVLSSIDNNPFNISGIQGLNLLSPFLCSLGLGGFIAAYVNGKPQLMWTKHSNAVDTGDIWHFSYDETVSLLMDAIKDEAGHIYVDEEKRVLIDYNNVLLRGLREECGISYSMLEEGRHGMFEVGIILSDRLEVELISQATIYMHDSLSPEDQFKEMLDSSNIGYTDISRIKLLSLKNRKELIGKLLTPESYAAYTRMRDRLTENVGKKVKIGVNSLIEDGGFIDDGVKVGDDCSIMRNVYIGKNVQIGKNVIIQDNNHICDGVTLEDGVFIGSNVSFINNRYPRPVKKNDQKVTLNDWELEAIHVCYGATIGAGSVIMGGITIGKWAMVEAGSVVVEDVPERAMVSGNPARVVKTNINY